MKIYSIYDIITAEYGVPFVAVNDDDCKRRVGAGYQNNPFTRDLKLFCIGSFSVDSGEIVPCTPQFLCNIPELFEVVENG